MQQQLVGARLKQVRKRHQLSQRKLAQKSGVANATISLIENGKLNPTVSMLKKVLDGIPMQLSTFFSDEQDEVDKYFFRANEFTEIADGGISYRQLGKNLAGKSIQLMRERYEPGTSTGRNTLSHEGEECGIILSGQLTIVVADKKATLGAGDAYYFDSRLPHSFSNEGNEVCELISACTPPTF